MNPLPSLWSATTLFAISAVLATAASFAFGDESNNSPPRSEAGSSGAFAETSSTDKPPVELTLGVQIPAGRPDWVERPMYETQGVTYLAVASEPFASLAECERRLDELLVEKTARYVDEYFGRDGAAERLGLDAQAIRDRYLAPQGRYEEELGLSVGPMHQVHVLLKFDPAAKHKLERQWRDLERKDRVLNFAMLAGGGVALLAGCLSLLRWRRMPRGAQRGRLLFGVAPAIVLVAVTMWLGWRMMPPLS